MYKEMRDLAPLASLLLTHFFSQSNNHHRYQCFICESFFCGGKRVCAFCVFICGLCCVCVCVYFLRFPPMCVLAMAQLECAPHCQILYSDWLSQIISGRSLVKKNQIMHSITDENRATFLFDLKIVLDFFPKI